MLLKKNRLSKTADINLTTAKGRTFFSQSFLIKFLNKPDFTDAMITVVASVKISKSAVVRNRLKRIIRQDLHNQVKHMKPGYYVFILKKTAVDKQPQEIREELTQSLRKSKII